MNKHLIIVCLILNSTHLVAEIKDLEFNHVNTLEIKPAEKSISASLIIPCHPAHTKHLNSLLRSIEEQSDLPDEVLISLSEYKDAPADIMTHLEQSRWAFPITIILSEQKLHPGQNRNVASSIA